MNRLENLVMAIHDVGWLGHAAPFEFSPSAVFLGAVVRMGQAFIHAAPTVVVGILVAAVFRSLLGREQTFRVFGGHTWRQIPQAWAMGMLLPVCSLGALPVMSELRRAGLVGGTVIAFGLTAPIFNPVSVLYGLSLSHPVVILTICLCSLVIVTVVGSVWDRVFPREHTAIEPWPTFPYGGRRIAGVGLTMFRIAWSRDTLWIAIGIVGVGLLSTFLAPGALQTSAEHKDVWAPVRMASVSLPAYVTPMDAMVQLSNMFQHGNSIAAAFTLLILGTGLNLGILAWSIHTFRVGKTLVWLAMTTLLVIGLGYAIDGPLYPTGIVPEGHTHAYDNFCLPALDNRNSIAHAWTMLASTAAGYEIAAVVGWGILLIGGIAVAKLDPKCDWERRLAAAAVAPPVGKMRDIVLPKKVVGGLSIVGLIGAGVIGCFIFYPPAPVVLGELTAINAETCSRAISGDTRGALHWIPVYEDRLKKLEVGIMLRGGALSSEQSASIHELEETLEELEHALNDRHLREGRQAADRLASLYSQFREKMR